MCCKNHLSHTLFPYAGQAKYVTNLSDDPICHAQTVCHTQDWGWFYPVFCFYPVHYLFLRVLCFPPHIFKHLLFVYNMKQVNVKILLLFKTLLYCWNFIFEHLNFTYILNHTDVYLHLFFIKSFSKYVFWKKFIFQVFSIMHISLWLLGMLIFSLLTGFIFFISCFFLSCSVQLP